MIFLSIFLRASHNCKFFYVSYRAFGRESGRTRRLKPGQLVLRSRSESTGFAYTPDSDSEDYPSSYLSASRSVSPTMSNSNGDPNQNATQANQPSLQSNVQSPYFNHPLVYPTVPAQPNYGGPVPNPPQQPVYNPAPMQVPPEMYNPAQFFHMMANMQQFLRNTSFYTYINYKDKNRNMLPPIMYRETKLLTITIIGKL